jgi:hypothetical protein
VKQQLEIVVFQSIAPVRYQVIHLLPVNSYIYLPCLGHPETARFNIIPVITDNTGGYIPLEISHVSHQIK